ncbi:MAG: hypothetical protein LBK53_05790, partial [Heliobacteriaceae bacterium]|nr:hypothetical protein [Heliobacteriaceae bacterium]
MSVQAVDVSTETAFINAVKGNSETEINVTADINFTKDLGTRKNINLKINGNGYNLNMINSNVKNGLKIQDDTNTFQAEISNLTFKNALVNALTTELKKGVSSSITITNSQFLNNETAKDTGGGAIYNDIAVAAAQTKTINISNTIFSGNISSHETKGRGGAISNKIENVPGIVNININSVFTANEVMDSHSADVGGGAIYNHIVLQDNGQANINMSGQYSDNVTNNAYGGAIYNYINNKDNSSALVNLTIGYDNAPTLFEKNLADEHGGAVYNYINSKNKSAGVVTINIKDNVSFIDNTSYDNGGAVANYVEGKGENITFNIDGYYESNQASNNNGGAVYNYINKDYNSSTLTAFNIKGTYKDNLAEDAGGAVYFENVNNGLLEVNILGGTQFIENTSYERWGGALAFDDTNNTANSLHITSNSSSDGSGDIIFKGNQGNINNIEHGPNDIYVIKDGNETFTIKFDGSDGKVLLEGGIRGRALNGGKVEIEKSNAGTLEFGKDSLNNNFDGDFTQTGGTTIFRGTSFFNGNLVFNNSQGIGSNLNLWQEKSAVTINNLSLNNININTVGDSGSGNFTAFSLPNAVLSGTNNFIIDANALTGESDRFADIANASGIINISSVNFIDLPLTEYVDYQIFSGNDLSGVNFTAADGLGVTTHVARYKFSALSGQKGIYRLAISNFNPQVFRGQAATLAVYQNQLIVNNTLFDHV